MLPPEAAVRIVRRQQRQILRSVNFAERRAVAAWNATTPISTANAERFVELTAPIMQALRNTTAAQTRASLVFYLEQAGATPTDLDLDQLVSRINSERLLGDLLNQPVVATRFKLGREGSTESEALTLGRKRLRQLIDTDAGIVQQNVEHATMTGTPGVIGWRRVPDITACERCLAASMQRYSTQHLRAMHENCHCGVAAITGTTDPGQVVERMTRAQAKESGVDLQEAIAFTVEADDSELGLRLNQVRRSDTE